MGIRMLAGTVLSMLLAGCGGGGTPPPQPPSGGTGPDRSAYTLNVDGPSYIYAGGESTVLFARSDIVVAGHDPRWMLEGPGRLENATSGPPDLLVGGAVRYVPPASLPGGPTRAKVRFTVYNVLRKADQTSPDREFEIRVVDKPMELKLSDSTPAEVTIRGGGEARFGVYTLPMNPLNFEPQARIQSISASVTDPGMLLVGNWDNGSKLVTFTAPPTVIQDYDVVLTYTAWDPWFNRQANTLTFTVHVRKP